MCGTMLLTIIAMIVLKCIKSKYGKEATDRPTLMLAVLVTAQVTSAVIGTSVGKIFADAAFQMLIDHDLIKYVPGVALPFDADASYLDEILGYGIAAVGFGFQFFSGFALPFPLNVILLPLTIVEWFLRVQISMGGVH